MKHSESERHIDKIDNRRLFFDIANEIQGLLLSSEHKNPTNNRNVDLTLYCISRSVIDRAKTIIDLVSIESYESIGVLSRSLLELYISVEYILHKRSEVIDRERAFYYNSRLNDLDSVIALKNLDPDGYNKYTPEVCNKEVPNAKTPKDLRKYYRTEFNKLFKVKLEKGEYRNWYDLDEKSKTSIKILMNNLNMDEELFILFYKIGSMDVHGSGVYNYISVRHGSDPYIPHEGIERLSAILTRNTLNAIREFYGIENNEFKAHFILLDKYLELFKEDQKEVI